MAPLSRWLCALGFALAWGDSLVILRGGEALFAPEAALWGLPVATLARPEVWGGITAVYLGAVLAWALGRGAWLAGLVATAVLGFATWVEHTQLPEAVATPHGAVLPGAALTAWVLGRLGPRAGRERRAVEAMIGAMGGCYAVSAGSKLAAAGLGWAEGHHVALLVAERVFGALGPLGPLRAWVAEQPLLCAAFAVGTLLLEGAGVLLLWPRLRRPVALALLGMHAAIAVLLGYVALAWAPLLVAVARGIGDEQAPDRPVSG